MNPNLQLAERLREGLAADIWYDAAHHGDQAAAAKIEDAQEAMQEAAVLLSTPNDGQIVLREDHHYDGYTDYSTDLFTVGDMVVEMGLTTHPDEGQYLTFHVGTSNERGDPVEYPISREQSDLLLAQFGAKVQPTLLDRLRAVVSAKQAYWDALTKLECDMVPPGALDVSDRASDRLVDLIDNLADLTRNAAQVTEDDVTRAVAIAHEVANVSAHPVGHTPDLPGQDRISPLPLFYVRDADNDHDLLVRASDAAVALMLWHAHYELEVDELPTYIGKVPLDVSGAIDWDIVTTNAVQYKPFPN